MHVYGDLWHMLYIYYKLVGDRESKTIAGIFVNKKVHYHPSFQFWFQFWANLQFHTILWYFKLFSRIFWNFFKLNLSVNCKVWKFRFTTPPKRAVLSKILSKYVLFSSESVHLTGRHLVSVEGASLNYIFYWFSS